MFAPLQRNLSAPDPYLELRSKSNRSPSIDGKQSEGDYRPETSPCEGSTHEISKLLHLPNSLVRELRPNVPLQVARVHMDSQILRLNRSPAQPALAFLVCRVKTPLHFRWRRRP